MINIYESKKLNGEDILSLYKSLDWTNYTKDPLRLEKAIMQSLYVVTAFDDQHLIGLIRVVGDDESIVYIQDILIRPDYQNQGVGTMLFDCVKKRFSHVRQMVLMTDKNTKNSYFYRKQGLIEGSNYGLELFVLLGD